MTIAALPRRHRALALAMAASCACATLPARAQPDDTPIAKAPEDAGRFVLAGVLFRGNSRIGSPELESLATDDVGREVTLADLDALAARITAAYRARGYFLAQALVPQQKIEGGRVEITVLEGRLGKVNVRVSPDAPIGEERIRAVLAQLPAGEPLQQSRYERAMLLLSDLPGLKVKSGLEQGAETGSTDLVVDVTAGERWQGSIGADNFGTPASGTDRATAIVRYASPLRIGDNLDLRVMSSFDTNQTFGRLSYEAPVGAEGLRLGAGVSRVDYELGAQLAALGAHGIADVFDLSAGYPLLRSRSRNAFLRAALEAKRLKDVTDAVELQNERRERGLSLGVTWEARDTLLGAGYTNASASAYVGKLEFLNDAARLLDQDPVFGHRTEGQFTKLNLLGSRLQSVYGPNNLYLSFAGQWSDVNLDPAEKMPLGGDGAVRAYSSDEVIVDSGAIGTAEWRYSATEHLVLQAFYDIGSGAQWRAPNPTDTRNHRTLRGAGLGLTWDAPYAITLRVALAWRIGDPPLADPGNDNPRVLAQIQKAF